MSKRSQLMNELIGILTSSLAFRSEEDLETILAAVQSGAGADLSALNAPNDAATIYIRPDASKEAAVLALREMAEWIDEHWEQVAASEEPPPPPRGGLLN